MTTTDLPSLLPWLPFLGQVVLVVVAFTRTNDRANDAKKIALEAHAKIAAMEAAHGLYRERIAGEMVTDGSLRETKNEIMDAIRDLTKRFDAFVINGKLRGEL